MGQCGNEPMLFILHCPLPHCHFRLLRRRQLEREQLAAHRAAARGHHDVLTVEHVGHGRPGLRRRLWARQRPCRRLVARAASHRARRPSSKPASPAILRLGTSVPMRPAARPVRESRPERGTVLTASGRFAVRIATRSRLWQMLARSAPWRFDRGSPARSAARRRPLRSHRAPPPRAPACPEPVKGPDQPRAPRGRSHVGTAAF